MAWDILWKPNSDGGYTRGLSVVLPGGNRYTSARVLDANGQAIETLKPGGYGSHGFKFFSQRPGGAYGQNVTLEVADASGNTKRFNIANPAQRYEGNYSSGEIAPGDSAGGSPGTGQYTPGNTGYGYYPADLSGMYPNPNLISYDPISGANYQNVDPMQFAAQYGEFNRGEILRNTSMANQIAMSQLDAELQGLAKYAPAAAALKRQETSIDNIFNQEQRSRQVEQAMPGVTNQLTAQSKRAEAYAAGRVPDEVTDRALELNVRSAAADKAAAGGFGASSSVARKTSDLMSADARVKLSQYGDQLLQSNITQRQNLLLAPTEYSDAGSQINVRPTLSGSQLAQGALTELNNRTTISTENALQSTINQNQFQANLEQNTQQFNATNKMQADQFNANVKNQFAMGLFNYQVNLAGAIAGAGQTNSNTQLELQQQQQYRETMDKFRKEVERAQATGNWSQFISSLPGFFSSMNTLFGGSTEGAKAPSTSGATAPSGGTTTAPTTTNPNYTPPSDQFTNDIEASTPPPDEQVQTPIDGNTSNNTQSTYNPDYGYSPNVTDNGDGTVNAPNEESLPSGMEPVQSNPDGSVTGAYTRQARVAQAATAKKDTTPFVGIINPDGSTRALTKEEAAAYAKGGQKGLEEARAQAAYTTNEFQQNTGVKIIQNGNEVQLSEQSKELTNSVLRNSGMSYEQKPGMVPAGTDRQGRQVYSLPEAAQSQDRTAGERVMGTVKDILDPMQVFSKEDASAWDKISSAASSVDTMNRLYQAYQSGDRAQFVKTVLNTVGMPVVNNTIDDKKTRDQAGIALAAYNLFDNWDRMSVAQRSLALGNLGIRAYRNTSGVDLYKSKIPGTKIEGYGELTVGEAMQLFGAGINVYSLVDKWDQMGDFQRVIGAGSTIRDIAAIAQQNGWLGAGISGTAVNVSADALSGWVAAPELGVGAIASVSSSAVPEGYVAVQTLSDGTTLAVPAANAATGTADAGGEAAAAAGSEGGYAGTIGQYLQWAAWAYQAYQTGKMLGNDEISAEDRAKETRRTAEKTYLSYMTWGLAAIAFYADEEFNGGNGEEFKNKTEYYVNPGLRVMDKMAAKAIDAVDTGKDVYQQQRDRYRDALLENNAGLFDENYQGTLADGSTVDFGKDAISTKRGGTGEQNLDFDKKEVQVAAAFGDAIAASQGLSGQSREAVAMMYTAAAIKNAKDNPEEAIRNMNHFAAKLGLDRGAIQEGLNARLAMKIAEGEASDKDFEDYAAFSATMNTNGLDRGLASSARQLSKEELLQEGAKLKAMKEAAKNKPQEAVKKPAPVGGIPVDTGQGSQQEGGAPNPLTEGQTLVNYQDGTAIRKPATLQNGTAKTAYASYQGPGNVYAGWGDGGSGGPPKGMAGGSAFVGGLYDMVGGKTTPQNTGGLTWDSVGGTALAGNVIKPVSQEGYSERAAVRTNLQQIGLIDRNNQITLADGSKVKVGGKDYRRTAKDAAKESAELSSHNLDYTNDLDYMAGIQGVAMSRVLNGGKAQAVDQVGVQLGNAMLGKLMGGELNRENFSKVQANIRAVYASKGLKTKADLYRVANKMFADGRINEADLVAMQQAFSMIYDANGWETAQQMNSNRWSGVEAARNTPVKYTNNFVLKNGTSLSGLGYRGGQQASGVSGGVYMTNNRGKVVGAVDAGRGNVSINRASGSPQANTNAPATNRVQNSLMGGDYGSGSQASPAREDVAAPGDPRYGSIFKGDANASLSKEAAKKKNQKLYGNTVNNGMLGRSE